MGKQLLSLIGGLGLGALQGKDQQYERETKERAEGRAQQSHDQMMALTAMQIAAAKRAEAKQAAGDAQLESMTQKDAGNYATPEIQQAFKDQTGYSDESTKLLQSQAGGYGGGIQALQAAAGDQAREQNRFANRAAQTGAAPKPAGGGSESPVDLLALSGNSTPTDAWDTAFAQHNQSASPQPAAQPVAPAVQPVAIQPAAQAAPQPAAQPAAAAPVQRAAAAAPVTPVNSGDPYAPDPSVAAAQIAAQTPPAEAPAAAQQLPTQTAAQPVKGFTSSIGGFKPANYSDIDRAKDARSYYMMTGQLDKAADQTEKIRAFTERQGNVDWYAAHSAMSTPELVAKYGSLYNKENRLDGNISFNPTTGLIEVKPYDASKPAFAIPRDQLMAGAFAAYRMGRGDVEQGLTAIAALNKEDRAQALQVTTQQLALAKDQAAAQYQQKHGAYFEKMGEAALIKARKEGAAGQPAPTWGEAENKKLWDYYVKEKDENGVGRHDSKGLEFSTTVAQALSRQNGGNTSLAISKALDADQQLQARVTAEVAAKRLKPEDAGKTLNALRHQYLQATFGTPAPAAPPAAAPAAAPAASAPAAKPKATNADVAKAANAQAAAAPAVTMDVKPEDAPAISYGDGKWLLDPPKTIRDPSVAYYREIPNPAYEASKGKRFNSRDEARAAYVAMFKKP